MAIITEADIIKFLKSGKTYTTADIYKALGGNKSKDVRSQLDDLYKQGLVERSKISNSYFWTMKESEKNEHFELEDEASENISSKFYSMIIKQLKEEIRFLRCTVSDILSFKHTIEPTISTSPAPSVPQLPQPSAYSIFPTETPVIRTPLAPSDQPPPPPPLPSIQSRIPTSNSTNFATPKRTSPPRQSVPFVLPLSNTYAPLQQDFPPTAPQQPTSVPEASPVRPTITQAHQRTALPQPKNIGPHINMHPERDLLPSQLSRASTPATKAKVVLLGDSNFNRIIIPEMNSLLKTSTVTKFSYSGATSVHLRHYSDVLLESKPDAVLIHGGTNNIWGKNQRKKASSQTIAKDIISIGLKCRQGGVKTIYISSILTTRLPTTNRTAGEINTLLKLLCIQHNFNFIDNSFITENDLHQGDEVHLSWEGRKKLVTNYLKILNN